jgi:hypothetical protein
MGNMDALSLDVMHYIAYDVAQMGDCPLSTSSTRTPDPSILGSPSGSPFRRSCAHLRS